MKISIIFIFLFTGMLQYLPAQESMFVHSGLQTGVQQNGEEEENFYATEIHRLSGSFFGRLIINFASVLILIRLIYFPNYKRKGLFFVFFVFNLIIFLITYMLNRVNMGLGVAFGLFAVFSMLRYRTENISARDMTYLFLAIAIGLITAISRASAIELSILNALVLLVVFLLEGNIFMKKEYSKSVQYDRIDLIQPEHHQQLIDDLKKRTGLNIHRIAVNRVDFLKDTAIVKVYYYAEKSNRHLSDHSDIVSQTNGDD